MSRVRRLAVLTAVVACCFCTLSCVDRNPPPNEEPDEYAVPFPEVNLSAEPLDGVRRAELRRRARRPDGDPARKYAFNYDGVLKGFKGDGKRPEPKPAEAMPATACRSVEPTPKQVDRISGPGWVHELNLNQFENQSGFGFTRMLAFENKRGIAYSSKAIDRVELISLLTAPQLSAYVLDEMATPVLALRAKRRPLDEFERLGLDAVRRGEELVWTREAPKRMFGAIRAKASCLDCHSKAKEGDLLGAFSYYLDVPVDQIKR